MNETEKQRWDERDGREFCIHKKWGFVCELVFYFHEISPKVLGQKIGLKYDLRCFGLLREDKEDMQVNNSFIASNRLSAI